MSRELEFGYGHWEGEIEYTCDCCNKMVSFPFSCEEDAKDYDSEHRKLNNRGWIRTKVNGNWKDFCSEKCRNEYIRKNTI